MPQMMPINWIFSFSYFICIFMLFIIINYYIYFTNPLSIYFKNNSFFLNLKKKNNLMWKW